MTPNQISKIRGLLTDLLTGDCKELVETMLRNINGGVFTTNLLTLYNTLADRGKLFVATEGGKEGGLGGGNVPDSTAEIYINFGWRDLQWVALEELTHANGPAGTGCNSGGTIAWR